MHKSMMRLASKLHARVAATASKLYRAHPSRATAATSELFADKQQVRANEQSYAIQT